MTSKAISAVLVAIGLIAGGGITLAHYAAADSATNTSAVTSNTNAALSPQEENDASEKAAEQSMTPAQIQAKETAENDAAGKDDQSEMNDATEAQLSPAQKAAHDSAEAGTDEGNDVGGGGQEAED